MKNLDVKTIKRFVNKKNVIGFVGATVQKDKWGYKKFKSLKDAGYTVYPINPKYDVVDGDICFQNLESLIAAIHKKPDLVVTIIPPQITERVVIQCKKLGIDKIWMQPGSESERAIRLCTEYGISVVHGICIVVDALQKL